MQRRAFQILARVVLVMSLMALLFPADALAGKKSPLHKKNFPPGERQVIDGVWSDPWGTWEVRFERGRAYQHRVLGKKMFVSPDVWFSEIERVAAGRYRGVVPAENPMWGRKGSEVTISILDENQIVVRAQIGDRTFEVIKLDNQKDYLKELEQATLLGEPEPEREHVSVGAPELRITRTELVPGMLVDPGSPFELEVDFVVTGTATERETASVVFAYTISSEGATVFDSEPTLLDVPVGLSQSRHVQLTASEEEGDFEIEVMTKLGGAVATSTVHLLVGGKERLLDALAGTWVVAFRHRSVANLRIKLDRTADGLSYTMLPGEMTKHGWIVQRSSVEVTADQLVVTTTIHAQSLGMTMTGRDTLALNGGLDQLHGIAEVIDAGKYTHIGETFNLIYFRQD